MIRARIRYLVPLLLLVVLGGTFAWLRWRPSPPLVVARDTTYLTTHLLDDGGPDYYAYLRERNREGVTPENNAAVLIVQAVGPPELAPEDREAWFAELGSDPLPEGGDYLVEPNDGEYLQSGAYWCTDQFLATLDENDDEAVALDAAGNFERRYEAIVQAAMKQPWTPAEVPPLAEWLERSQPQLDLVVAASQRARFYDPMVPRSSGRGQMLEALLAINDRLLLAARCLAVRAMGHVGEGRFPEAQRDILALHRLARLLDQPPNTLIDLVISRSLAKLACDAHMALVSRPDCPPQIALESLQALESLKPVSAFAHALDEYERFLMLDTALAAVRDPEFLEAMFNVSPRSLAGQFAGLSSIDANYVLRDLNAICDQMVQIARTEDRDTKIRLAAQLEDAVFEAPRKDISTRVRRSLVSQQSRSEGFSYLLKLMMVPAVNGMIDVDARMEVEFRRLKVAFALALYRADEGEYPETLDALVPELLNELPVDLFSGEGLKYERRGDGYLLYSVGRDGIDHGGHDESGQVVAGEWVADPLDAEEPSIDESDLVIRVPVPPLVVRHGEDGDVKETVADEDAND